VFVVGLLNTLLSPRSASCSRPSSAFSWPPARLSPNWLRGRGLGGGGMIELIRNPLRSVQLLFGISRGWARSGTTQSISLFARVFLNNRGIIVPAPVRASDRRVSPCAPWRDRDGRRSGLGKLRHDAHRPQFRCSAAGARRRPTLVRSSPWDFRSFREPRASRPPPGQLCRRFRLLPNSSRFCRADHVYRGVTPSRARRRGLRSRADRPGGVRARAARWLALRLIVRATQALRFDRGPPSTIYLTSQNSSSTRSLVG